MCCYILCLKSSSTRLEMSQQPSKATLERNIAMEALLNAKRILASAESGNLAQIEYAIAVSQCARLRSEIVRKKYEKKYKKCVTFGGVCKAAC